MRHTATRTPYAATFPGDSVVDRKRRHETNEIYSMEPCASLLAKHQAEQVIQSRIV
jgi:hypothetical protein